MPSYFGGEVGNDVHAGGVEPDEERLAVFLGLVDEIERHVANLVVHGLHALGIERAGVLDLLFADLAPSRISVESSLSVAQLCTMLRGPTLFNRFCG